MRRTRNGEGLADGVRGGQLDAQIAKLTGRARLDLDGPAAYKAANGAVVVVNHLGIAEVLVVTGVIDGAVANIRDIVGMSVPASRRAFMVVKQTADRVGRHESEQQQEARQTMMARRKHGNYIFWRFHTQPISLTYCLQRG